MGVWAVGAGYNDFDIIFPEPPSLSPSLSLFLPSLSSLFSLSLFPLAPPLSVFSLPSFSRTRFWGTACSFRAIQAPHWVTLLAAAVPVRQLRHCFRSISHAFLTRFSARCRPPHVRWTRPSLHQYFPYMLACSIKRGWADWCLVWACLGACNPMTWPIRFFRPVSSPTRTPCRGGARRHCARARGGGVHCLPSPSCCERAVNML